MRHWKVILAEHYSKTLKRITLKSAFSLLNIWYKNNINSFSICQCGVQILSMISIRFHKSVSVTLKFWLKWPMGWTMCSLLIAVSDSVCMLGPTCVACNYIVYLHSFNKINFNVYLLFQRNLLMCTQRDRQCSSKRQSKQILFVWSLCRLWLFAVPSVMDIQLLP